MSVLVIAELTGSTLVREATAKAVTAARALGDVTLLVAGHNVADAAAAAARIAGTDRVLAADRDWLAPRLAEDMASLIADLAPGFSHVLAAGSASARGYLPRAAALADAMVLGDVTRIVGADTFERPIYAGNALETVQSRDKIKFLTVRMTAFAAAPDSGAMAPVESLDVHPAASRASYLADSASASDRPDLVTAEIVVSGGRGVGSAEGFQLVAQLADRLGAAIGASRAAVDAGYAASDLQVGQTGKVVAPRLYIAIGISGAIQHVAGMKDSGNVVVINTDEEAPISQLADYVWTANLFTAIPELIAAL